MGNVSASAKPLPSNVPATPTGLPELSKDLETPSDTNKSNNDDDRGNPGTMEELHKKCKGKRQINICVPVYASTTLQPHLFLEST